MNTVQLYNFIWLIFTLGQLFIALASLIGMFVVPMIILYFAFIRKQKAFLQELRPDDSY